MNNRENGERRDVREVMEEVYDLIGTSDLLRQLRSRAARGDMEALQIVARIGKIRADVLEVIKATSGEGSREEPGDEYEKACSDFIEEILRIPEANKWRSLTPEQATRFDELNFRVHVNPRLFFNPNALEATACFLFPDGRKLVYRELQEGVYGFIDRS